MTGHGAMGRQNSPLAQAANLATEIHKESPMESLTFPEHQQ